MKVFKRPNQGSFCTNGQPMFPKGKPKFVPLPFSFLSDPCFHGFPTWFPCFPSPPTLTRDNLCVFGFASRAAALARRHGVLGLRRAAGQRAGGPLLRPGPFARRVPQSLEGARKSERRSSEGRISVFLFGGWGGGFVGPPRWISVRLWWFPSNHDRKRQERHTQSGLCLAEAWECFFFRVPFEVMRKAYQEQTTFFRIFDIYQVACGKRPLRTKIFGMSDYLDN